MRPRTETTEMSVVETLSAPLCSSDESNSENESDFIPEIDDDEEFEIPNESNQIDHGQDSEEMERSIPTGMRGVSRTSNERSTLPSPGNKRSYTYIRRQPKSHHPTNMRKRWKEDIDSLINNINEVFCCKKLQCFKHCNPSFLRSKIITMRDMTYDQRRFSLMEMKGSSGRFHFDGSPVCNVFLKKAFRFSADIISGVRNGVVKSRLTDSIGSELQSQTTSNSDRGPIQRDAIITFLERMAENCGDKMPDQDETHLPYFRKRDVYAQFKNEFGILNGTEVKQPCGSYFYKTWKRFCRSIKVRKLGRFAKCTTCEQLRKSIHDAASRRDYKNLAIYRRQKAEHNELIAKERREYKKKRDKARLQPDQLLSIIVDGADQSAFGLPHFMIKTKDDRGHSLKVRLIGLLEHSHQNRLRLFTLTEEFPTGANHVVEAIHRFLTERINQGVLPRTFYIQVDNCTKENKNRFLFSYIKSLLRWKLFDEIVVAFLPVGHTHEDIDQTFSRTSDRLRCNDAITLSDLHGELRHVYNDRTSVGAMNNVVNWSGLCESEKCLTNLKHFSKYRYFRFHRDQPSSSLDPQDRIRCMIRVNVTDEWLDIKELSGRGTIVSFTKFAPNLRNTPPLHIKCPEGKDKITECIEAAESRIPSVEKVNDLLALRDRVFKERTEDFHWDLQNCVEINHSTLLREDEGEAAEEENNVPSQPSVSSQGNATTDYRYNLNSFVAVKTDDNEHDSPFWIAKINDVHKNNDNVITTLTVHWFDRDGKKDAFNSKYFPSYNNLKKKTIKTTPMRDEISVNSVLINFPELTKKHRLPAAVSQHLRNV